MARRGRPFRPGNIHGCGRGHGVGRGVPLSENIKSGDNIKGDDEVITEETTTYNEWCAAQGLVDLSSDQQKEGDICKLHDKLENISQSVDKGKQLDEEQNVKPEDGKQVDKEKKS